KASSFIRKVVLAENFELTIRDANPRVTVALPDNRQAASGHPALDLSRADDRLIAEALSFQAAHPDKRVELLTHDTSPLLTARQCVLQFSIIPDDWLLPPEPDLRDKRLADL